MCTFKKFAIFLMLAFMLTTFSMSTVAAQGPEAFSTPTAASTDHSALFRSVREKGTVVVIVGLDVPFQPEGHLGNRSAINRQRSAIARAQRSLLSRLSIEAVTLYDTIPYMVLKVDEAVLEALSNSRDVTSLQEDIPLRLTLQSSMEVIGAPNAWADGYEGGDQAVVIIDSGVDADHPFFGGRVVAEACFSNANGTGGGVTLCPNGEPSQMGSGAADPKIAACNDNGDSLCDHGTHVAGIAAGNGSDFDGVARDANIIGIQVFTRVNLDATECTPTTCTTSYFSDIALALDYVHSTLYPDYPIASINISIADNYPYDNQADCDRDGASMKDAIDNLRSVDIATVIGSGNNEWTDALSMPACISSAVAVGATTDDDEVAWFSNMHPMVDLLAPGENIDSSVPGGGFENKSGTSMAAPHVAGAWALLKEMNPMASVDDILTIFEETGVNVTDTRSGGSVTKPRIQLNSVGDQFGYSVAKGDFNNDGYEDLVVGEPGRTVDGQKNAGVVQVLYGSAAALTDTGRQSFFSKGPEAGDRAGAAVAVGDFNNDDYDDLAIGVPGRSIGNLKDVGYVDVIYGSRSGLSATGDEVWYQGTSGIQSAPDTGELFGTSLAAGDFDNDGVDDLAIGVPGEAIDGLENTGAVNVIYGTANGLSATGNDFWYQNLPGIADTSDIGDWFGASLAVGDFNGNGIDDLAIGVPGEAINSLNDAGAVNVIYGTGNGLSSAGNQMWSQNSSGILGESETGDRFGASVTAGDFNGDGQDDLAIGVPGKSSDGFNSAGAIHVIYGTASGLNKTGDQIWDQNSSGIQGNSEAGDRFGTSLTAGDFNGNGRDDLAIGVPGESVGVRNNAGAVLVIYGTTSGLNKTGDQTWEQSTSGIEDSSEAGDFFGASVVAGDFDGNGDDDLAIGVPGEGTDGAVNVLYGDGSGLSDSGDQFWR